MSLPLATTTISVLRLPDDDPSNPRDGADDPPERSKVATGIRAQIGSPSGTENRQGGNRTVMRYALHCDPFDFKPTDQIQDEATGTVYDLDWAETRRALIPHTVGGLTRTRGAA